MNIDKLERLATQLELGNITEEEFATQKERLLNPSNKVNLDDNKFGLTDDTYNMAIHLSQYLCFFFPLLGIIAPLFLWIKNKDHDPEVDRHGKAVINWNISLFIYYSICFVLIFFIIGLFLIWIPLILGIIWPIFGTMAAKDGKVWRYPLSIHFIK